LPVHIIGRPNAASTITNTNGGRRNQLSCSPVQYNTIQYKLTRW